MMTHLTLAQLACLVRTAKTRTRTDNYGDVQHYIIAVRWTSRPECGREFYSTNHASGSPEAGLSCVPIAPLSADGRGMTDEQLLAWLRDRLTEYIWLSIGQSKARPYIMGGWCVGRGADGEPLIEATTATLLGLPVLEQLVSTCSPAVLVGPSHE